MLLLFLIGCTSCARAKQGQAKIHPQEIAQQIFGDRFKVESNKENSHSIISQKQKRLESLFADLVYVVIEHGSGNVLWRDTLLSGNAYWLDRYIVRAVQRSSDPQIGKKYYNYNVQFNRKVDE